MMKNTKNKNMQRFVRLGTKLSSLVAGRLSTVTREKCHIVNSGCEDRVSLREGLFLNM